MHHLSALAATLLLALTGCAQTQTANPQDPADPDPPTLVTDGVVVLEFTGGGEVVYPSRGEPGRRIRANEYRVLRTVQPPTYWTATGDLNLFPDPGDAPAKLIMCIHDAGNWLPYTEALINALAESTRTAHAQAAPFDTLQGQWEAEVAPGIRHRYAFLDEQNLTLTIIQGPDHKQIPMRYQATPTHLTLGQTSPSGPPTPTPWSIDPDHRLNLTHPATGETTRYSRVPG